MRCIALLASLVSAARVAEIHEAEAEAEGVSALVPTTPEEKERMEARVTKKVICDRSKPGLGVSSTEPFAPGFEECGTFEPSMWLNDPVMFTECNAFSATCTLGHAPMLFPQLTPSSCSDASCSKPLVLYVNEEAKAMRSNWFKWTVAHDGKQDHTETPITLGELKSSAAGNRMMFKQVESGPEIFRMRQWKRLTSEPVFFVYSTVKDDSEGNPLPMEKRTLYTITKKYHSNSLPAELAGLFEKSGLEAEARNKQTLAVYQGHCTTDCADKKPVYQAIGQKSQTWKFFKNDLKSGVDLIPVGNMMREEHTLTMKGFNGLFGLRIWERYTDAGVLMAAVTMADLHQNSRKNNVLAD